MTYPYREYLIESIIPCGSVNLLGGASGSGKSRLSFQGMKEIQQCKTLFGYKCLFPVHQEYIAFDRTIESIYTTLNNMEIHLGDISLKSYVLNQSTPTIDSTIISKDCNLLWVDGIECLIEKLIDFRSVGQKVRELVRFADLHKVSIIALMGMAKMKESERYTNSREELIGSTAWGRFSDTIFTLGSEGDNICKERTLKILPRNDAPATKILTFDSKGHLVEIVTNDDPPSVTIVLKIFADHPTQLTTSELIGYASDAGISESSTKKAIDYLLNQGKIRKCKQGVYEKSYIS